MTNHRLALVSRPSVPRLTPAEQDVLALAELRNADIALVRGTSRATVKAQMRSVMGKLGVETRTAAVLAWQTRRSAETLATTQEPLFACHTAEDAAALIERLDALLDERRAA